MCEEGAAGGTKGNDQMMEPHVVRIHRSRLQTVHHDSIHLPYVIRWRPTSAASASAFAPSQMMLRLRSKLEEQYGKASIQNSASTPEEKTSLSPPLFPCCFLPSPPLPSSTPSKASPRSRGAHLPRGRELRRVLLPPRGSAGRADHKVKAVSAGGGGGGGKERGSGR